MSEAALVHLQQFKFKHFRADVAAVSGGSDGTAAAAGASATAAAADPLGFVFDRALGIRPASTLNASGDSHDAALARLLARPMGDGGSGAHVEAGCEAAPPIGSIFDRSMF